MMTRWQLQEAKARFSELVRRAGSEGPQVVTCRGADAVVVLSAKDYHRLSGPRRSFVQHLKSVPKLDDDIVDAINERPIDTGRDIEF